jgi:hypothetical protein
MKEYVGGDPVSDLLEACDEWSNMPEGRKRCEAAETKGGWNPAIETSVADHYCLITIMNGLTTAARSNTPRIHRGLEEKSTVGVF